MRPPDALCLHTRLTPIAGSTSGIISLAAVCVESCEATTGGMPSPLSEMVAGKSAAVSLTGIASSSGDSEWLGLGTESF